MIGLPPQTRVKGVGRQQQQPTSQFVKPVGTHYGKVMYFGCICFRGELGFLDCDDICMCVVNKHFELLEFVVSVVTVLHVCMLKECEGARVALLVCGMGEVWL